MNDAEFAELQLRATIVPQAERWPLDLLHWQRMKAVVTEARARLSKARAELDEIDRNADLSREGKERQRRKAAAQAIADFEVSKTLARAREIVELAVAKQHVSPEIAEAGDATLRAMNEAEQGWRKAIDKIAERASLTKGPDTRR